MERFAASTFSVDMRLYSAGEHVPCAIIMVRRMTVSQDAAASWLIMTESAKGELLECFFMDL